MNKFIVLAVVLALAPVAADACGTRAPAVQANIDAAELAALEKLTVAAAHSADAVFIGSVTQLARPAQGAGGQGSVSFAVEASLKGQVPDAYTASWKEHFVYSCQPSAMFHNVGFRDGGTFIVYVRDGRVIRSAAADHLRSGLLTLEHERAIVVDAKGS